MMIILMIIIIKTTLPWGKKTFSANADPQNISYILNRKLIYFEESFKTTALIRLSL